VLFTLIGFAGMYLLLGLLYVVLVVTEALRGPSGAAGDIGDRHATPGVTAPAAR